VATERELVQRLRAGDTTAWNELLDRHTQLVWVVARSHRLDRSDAADAVQHTWTALAEHLPRLADPDRLCAWLVTTTRRESLRIRRRRVQEHPAGPFDGPALDHEPEPRALYAARDHALRSAFGCLPERCRTLLALHANAPELSYTQLAAALEMNAASIGRTKSRCLDHLRRLLAGEGLAEPA
jgi:RNA polymerase sigma factor (sigma-70 family)